MVARGLNLSGDLPQRLLDEARKQSVEDFLLTRPLVLGVSGGADSLAMLHLLCRLRGETASATLHVAHLNHWFRGQEARVDAEFVRQIARDWGLSSTIETFDVPNYARRFKLSAEDAARRVRYSFLTRLARERQASIAVAHNADDQVETVLMSILRGTGTSGLAGMQMLSAVHIPTQDEALSEFAPPEVGQQVSLFRPLLHIWRHDILEYCKLENLEPRFDTTNWEKTYRRNRVRHDLLPVLQMQYSLAVKDHLYSLSLIAHGDDDLLESLVDEQWQRVAIPTGTAGFKLDTTDFAALHIAMRRRIVRRGITALVGTLQDITFAHIEASAAILAGDPGSPSAMHLPHDLAVIRQGKWGAIRKRMVKAESLEDLADKMIQLPIIQPGTSYNIQPGEEIDLGSGWGLQSTLHSAQQQSSTPGHLTALFDHDALLECGPIVLRTRLAGDTIEPLGMNGHKSLQDLMVDAKIPKELREHVAVIALENSSSVLWVPGKGGRRSRTALLRDDTARVLELKFVQENTLG